MKYEDRVVLFVDILGFKNIINSTVNSNGTDNEQQIENVYNTFLSINDLYDINKKDNFIQENVSITQFSDSLVISFLVKELGEIFWNIFFLQLLSMRLISHGIICRGAISYGKLIHNDNIIFGPALIDAYNAELNNAKYPRIILEESIITLAAEHHSDHHLPIHEVEAIFDIVSEDNDGLFYIDYFGKALENLDDPYYDPPGYIEQIRNVIIAGLKIDGSGVKEKYEWMKNKFNELVNEIKENDLSNFDFELQEYYEELEYI